MGNCSHHLSCESDQLIHWICWTWMFVTVAFHAWLPAYRCWILQGLHLDLAHQPNPCTAPGSGTTTHPPCIISLNGVIHHECIWSILRVWGVELISLHRALLGMVSIFLVFKVNIKVKGGLVEFSTSAQVGECSDPTQIALASQETLASFNSLTFNWIEIDTAAAGLLDFACVEKSRMYDSELIWPAIEMSRTYKIQPTFSALWKQNKTLWQEECFKNVLNIGIKIFIQNYLPG